MIWVGSLVGFWIDVTFVGCLEYVSFGVLGDCHRFFIGLGLVFQPLGVIFVGFCWLFDVLCSTLL